MTNFIHIFPLFTSVFTLSTDKLRLFFNQNQLTSHGQMNQLNTLIPYLSQDSNSKSSRDNRKLLISRMLAGQSLEETEEILPMLIEDTDSVDLKNFYLFQEMLQKGIRKIVTNNALYFREVILFKFTTSLTIIGYKSVMISIKNYKF